MFSTTTNVEKVSLHVENLWQTGIFKWKTDGKTMENTRENAEKPEAHRKILVWTDFAG